MEEQEYNLTLLEVCESLNKTRKTIGRYIRRGKLHPIETKSRQGTLEWRFSKSDLDAFRTRDEMRQDEMRLDETGNLEIETITPPLSQEKITEKKTDETGTQNDSIVPFLVEQIKVKDEQIKNFQERDRETNILLKGFQQTIENGYRVAIKKGETGQDTTDETETPKAVILGE